MFLECICVLCSWHNLSSLHKKHSANLEQIGCMIPLWGACFVWVPRNRLQLLPAASLVHKEDDWQGRIGSSLYSLCTGTRACEDTGLSFTSGSAPGSWPFLQVHSSHLSLGTRVDNTEGSWDSAETHSGPISFLLILSVCARFSAGSHSYLLLYDLSLTFNLQCCYLSSH